MKNLLIQKINAADWWHVTPEDPDAYKKRGKFLASTYRQAAFYGRPKLDPEKVSVKNPLFGFSEEDIFAVLFGRNNAKRLLKKLEIGDMYETRIKLDAKMRDAALCKGYDAIVLMTKMGEKALAARRKPNSIELNLLSVS